MKQALKAGVRDLYARIPRKCFGGRALPPLNIALTVTYKCNLKCVMCLQRVEEQKARSAGLQELSGEEIRTLISKSVPKLARIGFCGGEIFLRRDIMDLLHFASRRNRVGFVSNGTLITGDMARDLVGMGVEFMLFSVDGPPHMHDRIRGREGTFGKVMASMDHILKAKRDLGRTHPDVHANCVVMSGNAGLLTSLIDDLASAGVTNLGLQIEDRCLHRWSTTVDSLPQLFERPAVEAPEPIENIGEVVVDAIRHGREKGVRVYLKPECEPHEFADYYNAGMDLSGYECTLPWRQIFISPHGDVYPCFMLKLGNVRDGDMSAVWQSPGYRTFRRALSRGRLFPQCYGCCFMQKKRT